MRPLVSAAGERCAAACIPANPPRKGWSRHSTRCMPNARPARPISGASGTRVGPVWHSITMMAVSPARRWTALPCSSSSIRARITAKSCQAPRGCRVELLRHRDEGGAPRIEDLCSAPIMTTPGSRQIVLQGRPTVSVWRTEYVNYVTPLPKMVSANRGQCSVIRRNRHHHHQPFRLRGIEESGSHLTRRWSKRELRVPNPKAVDRSRMRASEGRYERRRTRCDTRRGRGRVGSQPGGGFTLQSGCSDGSAFQNMILSK